MKHLKSCLLLLALILTRLLPGCYTCDKRDCVEAPHPFQFRMLDRTTQEDLIFSENPLYPPDSLRLYYYEDGEEVDLQLQVWTGELDYSILSNQILPYLSGSKFIKDYYLQLSHVDTDTLLLDVKQIDLECCIVFQWAESYYNGRVLKRSQQNPTVFLIEK